MDTPNIQGRKFRRFFVLLLVLVSAGIFLAIIWPFMQALVLAAILTGLFRPVYNKLLTWFRGNKNLAAAITLVILILLITGPLAALVTLIVQQAISISNNAIPWLRENLNSFQLSSIFEWVSEHLPWLLDFIPEQDEFLKRLGETGETIGSYLVKGVSSFTANTAVFLLNSFVMFYAMFFFLRDSDKILKRLLYYIPLGNEEEKQLMEKFASVNRATIRGVLLIGIIQGVLVSIGFYFAGIKGAAFWGAVTVVFSVMPGVGSALIWAPAVIYLYSIGSPVTATLLLIWGAGVVSIIDNVLRPPLVGREAKMPELLILVSTLGGLVLFGPLGFILGPILTGLFLSTLDIYAVTFKSILPPVEEIMLKNTDPETDKKIAEKKRGAIQ